jgi:hypothetical protein
MWDGMLTREHTRMGTLHRSLFTLAHSIRERAFGGLGAPSPCPSPPPGAREKERLPLPREGKGQDEGTASVHP